VRAIYEEEIIGQVGPHRKRITSEGYHDDYGKERNPKG